MEKLKNVLLLFIIFAMNSCVQCSHTGGHFERLSVAEFKEFINNPDVQLVDVRTAEEHAAGHIKGTKMQIDVLKPDFDSLVVANIQEGSTVALYCRSGNRSKRAASSLSAKGYRVIELATGYNGWTQAGKPVE